MFWYILLAILLIGMGLFMAIRPDLWWKATEAWKSYRADEPSDFYRITTRIGGIVLVVTMVVILIVLIVVS